MAGSTCLSQHKGWELHLASCCADDPAVIAERRSRLVRFVDHYEYRPSSQLESVAGNLYEDVGEVAMTLINLRFKQAEDLLTSIHLREDIT